ncbi:MAG TPA: RidA family protein [Aestuariivirgaceae bacterium]|jgi:enamine deaminase RidA (YjgF/YER057c/UK114 family)|nr:RidA family protein [Aestuariivirgaceae bacterium]
MGRIDARLEQLGIVVPTPAVPVANYVGFVRTGNLVFTAGQVTLKDGKFEHLGKVGGAISLEEAQTAARLCAINIIAQLKAACDGDLDRVRQIVKLVGFVNAVPEFTDHPKVINGASDLMVEVFGDAGKHARSAVGSGSLPLNVAVEVEAIAEVV